MNRKSMRVVTITAPQKAELQEQPLDPTPLGPQEVGGRTLVSLVSAGTELNGLFAGQHFPSQPGYAAVFAVEAMGPEVRDLAVGQTVFCMGRHRSVQRCARADLLPLPAGLPPEFAVFARMMGVSMSTLTTTAARPGEKVLITGLGPVGHLAAQIFQSCGYEVTAVDPVPARQETALAKGIRRVAAAVPAELRDAALALECAGHEQAVLDCCKAVRKGGEVVLVGVPWRRRTTLSAFDLLHPVFHRYVVLRSGWEWELPLRPSDFRHNSIWDNFATALRWLGQRRVNVEGLYDSASPADCQAVYQSLLDGRHPRLACLFNWERLSSV